MIFIFHPTRLRKSYHVKEKKNTKKEYLQVIAEKWAMQRLTLHEEQGFSSILVTGLHTTMMPTSSHWSISTQGSMRLEKPVLVSAYNCENSFPGNTELSTATGGSDCPMWLVLKPSTILLCLPSQVESVSLRFIERLCLQKPGGEQFRKKLDIDSWHTHTYAFPHAHKSVYTHMYTHTHNFNLNLKELYTRSSHIHLNICLRRLSI